MIDFEYFPLGDYAVGVGKILLIFDQPTWDEGTGLYCFFFITLFIQTANMRKCHSVLELFFLC